MRWAESFPWRRVIAPLLGAASVFAFAPFGGFPIVWLTLGGLYALLGTAADKRVPAREGALLGGLFGLGGFLAGVSWIFVSLSTFGGMPTAIAAFATLLFCAGMALYPALAGALFARLAPPPGWRRALVFAALWTLSEWLRGWVLTGFPWLAAGYAQTPPSPLAGFAPIVGVYGVSLLTALTGAFLAEIFRGGRQKGTRPQTAVVTVLLAALFCGGVALSGHAWTTPQGQLTRVALLQGNIAQDDKWLSEKLEQSLLAYYYLTRDNPARLTVLPEAALPMFYSDVPEDYLDAMNQFAARQDGDLLFGIVTGDWSQYANSAVSLGVSGSQRYDKSHLVPFGEFVPPGFAWFLDMVHIPMSGFTPGRKTQAPFLIDGQRIAVNICYEDAFGEEIIGALPEATILLNISNMAWFGNSLAPAQHLQIARMRALETGRMILRATNTGMTAIIGADGVVQAALPPFTRAALTGDVQGYAGETPYTRWGNWLTVGIAFLLLAFACPKIGGFPFSSRWKA
ncbi:MAG: apolipoprotein N-acyltransferase [Candidatus Accumulibacter sp.]|jgi:apolipoprotein N-acyltransferase|nr:apolipoprotein N-acyltransferase [Accumulibacter sp.]